MAVITKNKTERGGFVCTKHVVTDAWRVNLNADQTINNITAKVACYKDQTEVDAGNVCSTDVYTIEDTSTYDGTLAWIEGKVTDLI